MRITAQKVIEMFAELDLPVCDDGDLIKSRFDAKRDYYLKYLREPNPSVRAKVEAAVKNGDALLHRRPELLRAVYEHFKGLADIEIETTIDNLTRILREDCRVDDKLAQQFLEKYLQERASLARLTRKQYFIQWVKETFVEAFGVKRKPSSIMVPPLEASSSRMQLIWRSHKFSTNKDEMTIDDVLALHTSRPFTVTATSVLHPHYPVLGALPDIDVILDLSRHDGRAFARERVEAEGGQIQFVDDCRFITSRVEIGRLDDDERDLKRWFENHFRHSRYLEGVEVAICHSQGLCGLPAALVPCRKIMDSTSPKDTNTKDFDHRWVRTSSALLLNAESDLVTHLKGFARGGGMRDSELKNEIPPLVFSYAARFALERSLPDLDPGYQLDQWGAPIQIIKVVARLEWELTRRTFSPDEKLALEMQLLQVKRLLRTAEEKLGEQIGELDQD